MRSLLEQLDVEVSAFVREHRKAPTVELVPVKGDRLLGLITDVGTDYVELSGFYTGSPRKKIARSQIATIELLAEKHQHKSKA